MSKLTVGITSAQINLRNFDKPLVLFFHFQKREMLPLVIYSYLEFCHQPLLCKAYQVNRLEMHHCFFIAGSFSVYMCKTSF